MSFDSSNSTSSLLSYSPPQSSRTVFGTLSVRGFLDAGVYKVETKALNPVGETELTEQGIGLIGTFGNDKSGTQVAEPFITFPSPHTIQFLTVYQFQNLETMLVFAQQLGFNESTRGLDFKIDYASLVALI